jgi:asparagine synthase (glutamine-hydrolysing)
MPGLHFVSYSEFIQKESKSKIESSLKTMIHEKDYETVLLIDDSSSIVAASKHSTYKIRVYQNENFFIFLDGNIYLSNFQNLQSELIGIAKVIASQQKDRAKKITDWLTNTDGEFLILIKDTRSGHFFLLNDYRGLLPCYYFYNRNRFLFSREIRFILNLIETNFDKYNMSQYLMLNYVLGNRTLFRGVYRFPPGSLFKIDKQHHSIELTTFSKYNFENQLFEKKSMEENIENLVELFDEACRRRTQHADGIDMVLGLSGGRDSRAVCSGLIRAKVRFTGLSFYWYKNRKASADVEIAEIVAKLFGTVFQKIDLPAPSGADLLKLLELKSGLNGLGLAFMICWLRKLRAIFGNHIIYFTGDTGMSLRAYLPSKTLKSMDELLKYIINHDGRMSPKQVGRILNIKPNEIIDFLASDIESFPELDFNRKYTHFCMYGRGFIWHHEGMDRNRCYSHLMTPLEALPFAEYALHCSQEQKRNYRFFDTFLRKLSEKNNEIKLSEYNAPAGSLKTILKTRTKEFYDNLSLHTKQLIKTYILRNWDSYRPNSTPVRCLNDIFDNCAVIGDYFNIKETRQMIKEASTYQFDNILSLAACVEDFTCKSNSIERYFNEPFE